jgi:hypothetical protein
MKKAPGVGALLIWAFEKFKKVQHRQEAAAPER